MLILYHCHETWQHAANVVCERFHSFLSFGWGRYDMIWRTTSSGRNTGSLSLEDVVLDDEVKLSVGDCSCDEIDGDLLQVIKVSITMFVSISVGPKSGRWWCFCKWRVYKRIQRLVCESRGTVHINFNNSARTTVTNLGVSDAKIGFLQSVTSNVWLRLGEGSDKFLAIWRNWIVRIFDHSNNIWSLISWLRVSLDIEKKCGLHKRDAFLHKYLYLRTWSIYESQIVDLKLCSPTVNYEKTKQRNWIDTRHPWAYLVQVWVRKPWSRS